jgi:protein-disulfide isomerase
MKLTSESKLFAGIFVFMILIVIVAMKIMTQPAKPISRDQLTAGALHTIGPKDAKVWLVEFSDYECPACGQFYPTVKEITDTYKDQMLFVYRNYPLSIHPFSVPAARAAEAAALQGKYWEMHDALFTNQASFSNEEFTTLAQNLGLRMEAFTKDMQSDAVNTTVTTDQQLGDAIGVNATPTFYLNGVKLTLNTLDDLKTAVANAITASK